MGRKKNLAMIKSLIRADKSSQFEKNLYCLKHRPQLKIDLMISSPNSIEKAIRQFKDEETTHHS